MSIVRVLMEGVVLVHLCILPDSFDPIAALAACLALVLLHKCVAPVASLMQNQNDLLALFVVSGLPVVQGLVEWPG